MFEEMFEVFVILSTENGSICLYVLPARDKSTDATKS